MSKNDSPDNYSQMFNLRYGRNAKLMSDAFYIRYCVYAKDMGFEPLNDTQLETDSYDEQSLHAVLTTSETDPRQVGCVRVIGANDTSVHHELPFELVCRDVLDTSIVDTSKMERNSMCEISRLAVMANFRRRKGDVELLTANLPELTAAERFSYIPISLCFTAAQMAVRNKMEHIFMVTESRLAEHFSYLGVDIKPIGREVEHHGIRRPYIINVEKCPGSLRKRVAPLWDAIAEQLELKQVA